MELWCKIPREDLDDFALLRSEGLETYLIKGGIEAKFPLDDDFTCFYTADFPIDTRYYLKLWEFGGGKTKIGEGVIICGLNGEKLKPSVLLTEGHLANSLHAEFEVIGAHVIRATKRGEITIDWYQIIFIHDSVQVRGTTVWEGNIKKLPNLLNEFKAPVTAAHKKANCFHCREPHYILED